MDNLVGQKFNRLTVLELSKSKNGRRYWKCQCDCGNITEVDTTKLKNGHTKSCGCLKHKSNAENLTNKKFGKLLVLKQAESKNGKAYWQCLCDCGQKCIVRAGDLKSGKTQSCGCFRREKSKEIMDNFHKEQSNKPFIPKHDLKGIKIGLLTPIELNQSLSKEKQRAYWVCKCDCGNIVTVLSSNLLDGKTQSCGCLTSKGERKIREILIKNNIPFETQKKFKDCIFPNGRKASFDFYVNNEYLIEYDGEQHYLTEASAKGYYTKEKIDKIHFYDKIKDEWCKEHNILLIRIPYWRLDSLTIKDLKPTGK